MPAGGRERSSHSSLISSPAGVRSFAETSGSAAFWSPEWSPLVLPAEARPVPFGHVDAFDIQQFAELATVLRCEGHEHVLFKDGPHHLQLMVTKGSILDGPVRLRYLLSGFRHVDAKILTLRRFCHLWRFRCFPKSLYPPERRAARWTMMVRAWDAVQTGASQREIAAMLFGEKSVREDWDAGYLRTRVQRLIRGAERLIGGGYRELLK